MKRYGPWAAFAAIVAVAVVAVLAFDYSAVAHAQSGFAGMMAEAAAGAAAAEELVREFKAHHTEVKAALEKAGVKDSELEARMIEIEQKMARRGGGGGGGGALSWGAQFAKQAEGSGLSSAMRALRLTRR